MNNEQKLEQLNWLQSLPVVIDLDEEGKPKDLSQLNQLFERIEREKYLLHQEVTTERFIDILSEGDKTNG